MRLCSRLDVRSAIACALLVNACTTYRPALVPLDAADRFRMVADTPFAVTTARRDRSPTGSCRATRVTGRVLEIRGDTLVVGGSPILVPAPAASCEVAEVAIFVAPPNVRALDVRRPDAAKSVWAVGITAFVIYSLDALIHAAFPKS